MFVGRYIVVESYPSLLASFGLCDFFDRSGVDFPPFLLVLLHHFFGDGDGTLSVLILVINEPGRNFRHALRVGKSRRHVTREHNRSLKNA